jgi:uncharacterized Zn finger protein
MAKSTCPRCEGHEFERVEHSPVDESYRLMFVQCAECGTVFGIQDYFNVDAVVEEQNRILRQLAQRLESKEAGPRK